jgi:DNA-binding Lrp family transcriptional regulator
MRFIKLRPDQLDALDRRIIRIVDEEGEIAAAELRKRSRDLATLPAPTFYDRIHSLAKGGYLKLRHERQFVVLGPPDVGS